MLAVLLENKANFRIEVLGSVGGSRQSFIDYMYTRNLSQASTTTWKVSENNMRTKEETYTIKKPNKFHVKIYIL